MQIPLPKHDYVVATGPTGTCYTTKSVQERESLMIAGRGAGIAGMKKSGARK